MYNLRESIMLNFIKIFICGCLAFASGCAGHVLTNKGNANSSDYVCALNKLQVPNTKQMSFGNINFRKNTNGTIAVWLTYIPCTIDLFPDAPFSIIIKTLAEDKSIIHTYKFVGKRHKPIDLVQTTSSGKGSKKSKSAVTAQNVWTPVTNSKYSLYSILRAVSFKMSKEQLDKILEAEKTKILVETISEPLEIVLTKKKLQPVNEFRQACF